MSYDLILAFDTDNPEFCRGFEAGRLYTELRHCDDLACTHEHSIHGINAEMMLRIAEATAHLVEQGEIVDETWMNLTFRSIEVSEHAPDG